MINEGAPSIADSLVIAKPEGYTRRIMLHVALYQPEIPPNTGNIIRLCANAGAHLHLIHPLGFSLNEKQVRRAGLDYHTLANVQEYVNYEQFLTQHHSRRIFACTTKASQCYADVAFKDEDILLFGPETRGLPNTLLAEFENTRKIRIPMQNQNRSLNLSNATAVILYEAWRQLRFMLCK